MHDTTRTHQTRPHSFVAILAFIGTLGAQHVAAQTVDTPNAASTSPAAAKSPESAPLPDRPSFMFGTVGRVDLHARVQSHFVVRDDAAARAGDLGPADERLTFDRGRVGVSGVIAKRLEFQVEREVGTQPSWRDVFVDVRLARAFRVRGGQFKVPFSREQLSSMYELDFTARSAAVDQLVPLRSVGVMAHGVVADRAVRYQLGLFEHDRSTRVWAADASRLTVGRVTVAPLKDGQHRGAETLQVTAAWLRNPVADGRNGPTGRLLMGERFFDRMYASGRRTLIGGGVVWKVPAVTVAGELLRSAYTRQGQGLDGGNLSDLLARGGYASASWHLIGGKGKRNGRAPVRELDVTGRYDWITFGSVNTVGPAFRNPRADHVPALSKRTLTLGAAWHLNRWMAVHPNVVREEVVDALRLYDVARTPVWSAVLRTQVTM